MKSILLFFYTVLFTLSLFSQEFKIKFATLAPEGSTWINVMKEYDAAIRKESGGRLGFTIYAGGVAGDEKDVMRKIRLGQFHSAGVTGFGIGEVAKPVRVLDSPFMFKNTAEVDYILEQFDGELRKEFENGGFILLGWAEVGFVYVFTNSPVSKVEDMKSVKMWEWEGDPVADATFKQFGINPIQLSITDVLTSLQTGLINGVYTSPLAAVSLQWFAATKYMMDFPLTNSMGAVIISKREFDKMPADIQQILLKHGKTYMRKLTEQSRRDNQKSLETLKKNKIQFVRPDPKEMQSYDEIGKRARQAMVGRLFSQDLLTRVEKALADFRAKGGK
ncbi:MAG: TRAP transporter substrate-binding protein DctP [Ignavibacteriales bacterium]|nr:TRAP transporter substrate-binding protein DctP [Ignavibacteriales bacterium]